MKTPRGRISGAQVAREKHAQRVLDTAKEEPLAMIGHFAIKLLHLEGRFYTHCARHR